MSVRYTCDLCDLFTDCASDTYPYFSIYKKHVCIRCAMEVIRQLHQDGFRPCVGCGRWLKGECYKCDKGLDVIQAAPP